MKHGMKGLAVASAMTVGMVLAGGIQAGPAEAAMGDCKPKGSLCLWDAKNYQHTMSYYMVKAVPDYKCGRGAWKPPYADHPTHKRLPRSTWNRTTKTWYGKDSRGKDRQIVRKTGMRGSTDPDISAYKSIKKWCWK
ncbi:hypothetical protein [Streptomyces sp. HM190]|uniref:hypothetical protein n=1 Tax=Streptomyces sp. HM190 TaxID=2695266 RepID=UPI00135AFCDE|nr:hypothetical protein [Streptomyces sp. HM190]